MTIQEIQEQLKNAGIEATEEAIAAKLKSLKIKPADITEEIREIAIQDLVQAFSDEQNSSAIAPRKRTQKQAIADIKEWFAQCGLNYTEDRIKSKLQEYGFDPLAIDQPYVHRWAEQMKSGSLTTVDSSHPSSPQSPDQPQQQVNFQPITSTIHTTVEQLVRANHEGEQEAIAAVAAYLKDSPTRVVNGVSQQLATIDMSSPLDAVLQQQRSAWASTHDAIRQAIANVNDFAGVKSDAA